MKTKKELLNLFCKDPSVYTISENNKILDSLQKTDKGTYVGTCSLLCSSTLEGKVNCIAGASDISYNPTSFLVRDGKTDLYISTWQNCKPLDNQEGICLIINEDKTEDWMSYLSDIFKYQEDEPTDVFPDYFMDMDGFEDYYKTHYSQSLLLEIELDEEGNIYYKVYIDLNEELILILDTKTDLRNLKVDVWNNLFVFIKTLTTSVANYFSIKLENVNIHN